MRVGLIVHLSDQPSQPGRFLSLIPSPSHPQLSSSGIGPMTQGAARFVAIERAFAAACSAHAQHQPGGWLGPRAEARR
jgi:hypothetical protein